MGRIPTGALTDKYAGRTMLTLVMALCAPLTLGGGAGWLKSFALMLVFVFCWG